MFSFKAKILHNNEFSEIIQFLKGLIKVLEGEEQLR